MARMEIAPMDGLLKELARLERMDEIAPKMLDAASPILVSSVRRRLQPHNRTMHLMDSVTASKAKKAKTGAWAAKVTFKGYDGSKKPTAKYPHGVANSIKAMGLEVGNSHQRPQPFIQAAINDCEQEAMAEMQAVFDREVEK